MAVNFMGGKWYDKFSHFPSVALRCSNVVLLEVYLLKMSLGFYKAEYDWCGMYIWEDGEFRQGRVIISLTC